MSDIKSSETVFNMHGKIRKILMKKNTVILHQQGRDVSW